MKKLILIASLLISGSLWAETLNLCYMYTTQELYGFGFMQKNIDKCNVESWVHHFKGGVRGGQPRHQTC